MQAYFHVKSSSILLKSMLQEKSEIFFLIADIQYVYQCRNYVDGAFCPACMQQGDTVGVDNTRAHAHTRTHARTYTHTHTHTHTHACVRTHTHTHARVFYKTIIKQDITV